MLQYADVVLLQHPEIFLGCVYTLFAGLQLNFTRLGAIPAERMHVVGMRMLYGALPLSQYVLYQALMLRYLEHVYLFSLLLLFLAMTIISFSDLENASCQEERGQQRGWAIFMAVFAAGILVLAHRGI